MMRQRISKKFLIYLFFFLMFVTINNVNFSITNIFKIKDIEIFGLENQFNLNFEGNFSNLYNTNIILLEKHLLKNLIEANTLVENYDIFKKYPSKLVINITKTNFLARKNINGEFFLVGSNGKLTKNFLSNNDLPFIFGNPNVDDILALFSKIKKSKFKYTDLKNLFYYKSGRWDIETKKNIIIKLPREDLINVLNTVYDYQFSQNLKVNQIIDVRIKNQIILYD